MSGVGLSVCFLSGFCFAILNFSARDADELLPCGETRSRCRVHFGVLGMAHGVDDILCLCMTAWLILFRILFILFPESRKNLP